MGKGGYPKDKQIVWGKKNQYPYPKIKEAKRICNQLIL